MAISNVAIANRALQKLGEGRISSLDQDNPNARSINSAFEIIRDAELRRYAWSFAIARASIAADGDDPLWGDYNRYSLPADFIRLIRDDESGQRVGWKIEGQYILATDDAPLEIRYISRVEDPNVFDPLFVELFASKLAMETCEQITGSTSKKSDIKDDYTFALNEAKRVGAIEREIQDFPQDDWINARY